MAIRPSHVAMVNTTARRRNLDDGEVSDSGDHSDEITKPTREQLSYYSDENDHS
jgi:hypothetical protein